MKIARLLLAVVSLSMAAACTADITAPSPTHRSNDAAPTVTDTTSWAGGSGSGN